MCSVLGLLVFRSQRSDDIYIYIYKGMYVCPRLKPRSNRSKE